MKLNAGWNREGISASAWAELALHLQACVARRVRCDARGSLPLLVWGRRYLPHYFSRPPSAMHHWLAERLDAMTTDRGTKLNAIGPRGGAKSTIGTLTYALRAAVEGWEPYLWIVSDTLHQARSHLEHLKRELTENDALARDYPQAVGEGPTWRAHAVRLNNGVTIEAYGTGQRVRGKRSGASRPSLIICDDLQNDDHMRSAAARENSQRWFEGTLLKAGTPETNVLNLATALHRDALALRVHRTPGWTSQIFPAICRWPDHMDLWHRWQQLYCDAADPDAAETARAFFDEHRAQMESGAELLWPEFEDLYTLMQMRVEGGRTAFEREKQGSPLAPDSCEWPAEYFDDQIWFDQWPRDLRLKVIALDPSKGRDARRSDFSAYVLLGVDAAGVLYVDAELVRHGTPELVALGGELCQRFEPQAFGVETNQFQELLADELAAEFARRGLVHIHPWTIDNRVNKSVRIRRLGPYLAGRRLRFQHNSAGARRLVEQLQEFPSADHDDGPDALEMAIRLAGDLLAGAAGDNLPARIPVSA